MRFWTRFQSLLRRFLTSKRPFKLTKGGWVFILYTIGVGAGAINTGNNLLYLVFGLFLGFIMASGVLSDTDLWRVDVDWQFPEAAEAQKPCTIPLTIVNKKTWMPSVSMTISLEGDLEGQTVTPGLFVPSVLPREKLMREATLIPARRGIYALRRVRLFTSFPFGLLKKQWTLATDVRHTGFYVYPRLFEFTDADFTAFMAGHEERASSERRGEGSTVSGLREFVPSDNAKRIHWKASAKHGEWLVRETDLDEKRSVDLRWPAWSQLQGLSTDDSEDFIAFTASFLWGLGQRGQNAQFIVSNGMKVNEPLKYLAVISLADPSADRAQAFLTPDDASRPFDATVDLWGVFQQWKIRK